MGTIYHNPAKFFPDREVFGYPIYGSRGAQVCSIRIESGINSLKKRSVIHRNLKWNTYWILRYR